jgi:predicted nucleic acid-binding protein
MTASPVFVDTSALVAVLMQEPGAAAVQRVLSRSRAVHAANLVEAELRSVVHREEVDPAGLSAVLESVDWIFPARSLAPEYERILAAGYLRGADLWHLACALYLADNLPGLTFVTIDVRQRQVADSIGVQVGP